MAAAAPALTENKRFATAARSRSHTSRCTAASVRDTPAVIDQETVIQLIDQSACSKLSPQTAALNGGPATTSSRAPRRGYAGLVLPGTIEHYPRGIKQFCGVERAQRNRIGLCLRAFPRLE